MFVIAVVVCGLPLGVTPYNYEDCGVMTSKTLFGTEEACMDDLVNDAIPFIGRTIPPNANVHSALCVKVGDPKGV